MGSNARNEEITTTSRHLHVTYHTVIIQASAKMSLHHPSVLISVEKTTDKARKTLELSGADDIPPLD